MVVTVANVNAKDKMSNVLDICKYSRLGNFLRVTSSIKRFLHVQLKGSVGELQGSEIADAERV